MLTTSPRKNFPQENSNDCGVSAALRDFFGKVGNIAGTGVLSFELGMQI
jgi:hypothetical protein